MKLSIDNGLVLYVPMHETDGSNLMSRDAYGHACTVTGALWRPDGRYFDGTDDKIIGGFDALTDYPFTLAAWIKADVPGYVAAFSIGNNTNTSRNFYIGQADDSSGKASVWVRNQTPYKIFSANSIIDSSWHYLVGLYYSPTKREMYLDAHYEGHSTNYTGTYASVGVNELAIGCIARSTHACFWPGNVGEVFIYNRTLTPQEIRYNHVATKWRYQ